jgi:hypothetical protein
MSLVTFSGVHCFSPSLKVLLHPMTEGNTFVATSMRLPDVIWHMLFVGAVASMDSIATCHPVLPTITACTVPRHLAPSRPVTTTPLLACIVCSPGWVACLCCCQATT